jgi:hypothetical protein
MYSSNIIEPSQFISQRLKVAMPTYYSPTIKNYKINVAPIGKWRLFFYKYLFALPYFVGDKIELSIDLERTENEELYDTLTIWAKYPHNPEDKPYREMTIPVDGGQKEFQLVSKNIYKSKVETSVPGHIVIYIAESGGGPPYNIMTTDIYNDDNFNYSIVLPVGIAIILGTIAVLVAIVFR